MKFVFMALLAGSCAFSASGRVKLVALPERAKSVISLENSESTLVEEERVLTLQKGINHVDFAWRGVNIDPTGIFVRVMDRPGEIKVTSTSFPPNENALIWEIIAPEATEARARISYLIQGFTREIFYKAVADPAETSLSLRTYLRLKNFSGEDFRNADVRLGFGTNMTKDIAHEEVLELLSYRSEAVPIKKVLFWDAATMPWDPEYQKSTVGIPLNYRFTNSSSFKLGEHTLLPGKARIFLRGKDQEESVTFTGEDWAPLTPQDREVKLYIGQSRDVKITQRKTRSDRTNIRRNNNNTDVLWDLEEIYRLEIENFKKTPIDIVVVEHIPGYWKMNESSHAYEKRNAFKIEYPLILPPETQGDKKTVLTFHISRLNVQGNEPASY